MRVRQAGIVLAGALLVAGCGHSSSSSSSVARSAASPQTTPAPTISGKRVAGRDGGFTTVMPTGFTDATSRANSGTLNIQFAAMATPVNGFATNINVIRSQIQSGADVSRLTDRELSALRRQLPNAHGFSHVSSLSVAGRPARQLEYLAAPTRRVQLRVRQVFVLNNNFAYTITYTALPAAYSVRLSALAQVLSGWRWS